MDEAKANTSVNNDEDKEEENDEDPISRNSDINGPQHFLLPSPFTRVQKQFQDYVHKPGISKYDVALKHLIPIRPKELDNDKTMPADSAGLFSHIYVQWMTPYLWKAYKRGITIADLPPISPYDSANYNAQRLEALWQEELSRNGPTSASFKKIAWRFVRTRIFVSCFVLTCSIIFGFLSPAILMKKILEHVQSTEGTIWDGLKWVALLTLTDFLRTTFFAWTWVTNYRTAIRLKSACTAMLYRKIIRLNSLGSKNMGQLINLFSNDSQRLFDVIIYGPMIISGPIATTCGILYILWIFNPIALLGIIVFLLFYPCQYLISRITGYFRARTVTVTDTRVRLINEILECIKLIKMYSWENHFSKRLLDIRKKEQSLLRKTAYFQSLSISLTPAVPIISAIVTFLAQVSSGHNLKASEAFPITTLFRNSLRMALASLKDSTRYIVDALVAFRRIKVFPLVSLLNTQIRSFFMFIQVALVNIAESKIALNRLKSVILLEETNCRISKPIVKSQAISIFNGTFLCDGSISPEDISNVPNDKKKKYTIANDKQSTELEKLNRSSDGTKYVEVLTDINFDIAKGALIGICGPVGSGKSSLLLAALGQLRMAKGHITREGSCAYVSQQAWIVNATLRQNVLFGEQFNAKRYYQALTVCNLKEDLNMLPGGDETEIGERGINLSGGQKQRIALARALYANRDIYFLDDPLSAVDTQVGSYIFENLILRALEGKTVLFVTHQVQFLKHCRQVYMMHSGKIMEYGTHVELMQTSKDYASMVNSATLETDNNSSTSKKNVGENMGLQSVAVQNGGDVERMRGGGTPTLTVEEKSEVGQVKSHTYNAYIKSAGGYLVTALVICIFFLNVGSSAFSSWWLAMWINAGGGNVTNPATNETVYSENLNDNPDFGYYQTIYAACIGAILTMSLIRGFAITLTTINASTNLHNKVFKKMLGTSVKFFETTPSGRIQNIFSRDMDEVDNYLPISIENMIQNIFTCSFAIIFVCAVLPWYAIPLIFLGATFFLVSKLFRIAMRDFKRLESVSRAPVLSFITTTIQGLSTIHAFKKEKEFLDKFEELFDLNNLCLYLCQSGMRWSAVRLDSLAIASTCITAFLVIFLRGQISPALAGLAMAYCSQMSGVFQYTVRLMAETEVRFISVERINYYLRTLEQEGNGEKPAIKPQADWPAEGKIEFQKVQMKYRKDLPVVLIDITFVAQPGEKIGIVGRTGSGKSSLITALFRLVEISSGKIKIDNIDTSKISLDLLRSKLSIIPQDPALFSGSIRSNLDPFNEHSDVEIWEALEKTQLKERVQKLEESVGFGGNKLSAGEKQLLCLARALLRNSKILVLDEATASVDPETEAVVNNTIQNEFGHCTILTIAHRLSTVVSCDRILVMSNGRIIESGPPDALRNNPTTEFSKMMAAAEDHISGAVS